jgi:hypothetical protein
LAALGRVQIDLLARLTSEGQFTAWYEKELRRIAAAIRRKNKRNHRIHPGYKWGHATKVLNLFVREIVLQSRYFTDRQTVRLSRWLYTPVDSVVIRRLREMGLRPQFRNIKSIDTSRKFYAVQQWLRKAAKPVGVPAVWFDDNWGDRQDSPRRKRWL